MWLRAFLATYLAVVPPAAEALRALEGNPLIAVEAALRGLERRWPGPPEMLSEATRAIPARDGGAALREKLRSRLEEKQPFVFAAFGSSVSAGHDNFLNQSWPFELERLLQPAFEAAGFGLEVRQRSAGGYGEMPFAAGCLSARAGTGVDALSWEWGMFHDAQCEGYHFLSEARGMDRQPVVFVFADTKIDFQLDPVSTDRGKLRDRLLRNTDEEEFSYTTRRWRSNEWYFGEEFVSKAELAGWSARSGLSPNFGRVRSPTHTHLHMTGAATHFQNEGLGLYPVTVSASTKHVIGDPWYQSREKAFNINWHPGPLGHSLIASQLGHYLLSQLHAVLLGAPADARLGAWGADGPEGGNPLVGSPLTAPLIPKGDALACGRLLQRRCLTGMSPHPLSASLDIHRVPSDNNWTLQISEQVVERRESIDSRWVYHGTESSGELLFSIDSHDDGQYALFCGAPCGWFCKQPFGYVASKSQRWWDRRMFRGFSHAEGLSQEELARKIGYVDGVGRKQVSDLVFTVNGAAVPEGVLLRLHEELFDASQGLYCPGCKNAADLCQPVAKLSRGRHILGLRVSPHTYPDPNMSVEVLQLMLVG